MRLKNTTTIPNDLIREVIRFVRPSGISGFDVRASNTARGIAGTAYTQGSSYHDRACPFVVLRVGRVWPFDSCAPRHAGYLGTPRFENRIEGLVFLAAHELRHLWQARGVKRGRAKGSRGSGFSERDADTYAYEQLARWRARN